MSIRDELSIKDILWCLKVNLIEKWPIKKILESESIQETGTWISLEFRNLMRDQASQWTVALCSSEGLIVFSG